MTVRIRSSPSPLYGCMGCLIETDLMVDFIHSLFTALQHAFARDNGLPFSPFFARTNRKTGVPDNAVYLTTVSLSFGLPRTLNSQNLPLLLILASSFASAIAS